MITSHCFHQSIPCAVFGGWIPPGWLHLLVWGQLLLCFRAVLALLGMFVLGMEPGEVALNFE